MNDSNTGASLATLGISLGTDGDMVGFKEMNDSNTNIGFTVSVISNATLGVSAGTNKDVVGFPIVQIVIYLLVIIVIVLGNSVVITAVQRYTFLQTPTNVFVVGTAGLDLTMGVLGMFKLGQLVYVYEGYYTCITRLGIAVLQVVATGNVLAGTIESSETSLYLRSRTDRNSMTYRWFAVSHRYNAGWR